MNGILANPLHALRDPQTIFFWPYIVSALVVAVSWQMLRHRCTLRRALSELGARTVWITPSSRADALLCVGYLAFLHGPILALQNTTFLTVLNTVGNLFERAVPSLVSWHLPQWLEALLATAVTMVAIDLASYLVHRLLHHVRALWALHAVHHSASSLTPLTTYRQHPLEPLILNTARGLAAALGLSLFHALFPQHTPVITIYGLGAGFFIYMFTVNLHHAPVPVRYPRWLRVLFISPHIHHLHHSASPRHADCNFGVVFAVWDRLFGTYVDEPALAGLTFGLASGDRYAHSVRRCLWQPVADWAAPRTILPTAATARTLS